MSDTTVQKIKYRVDARIVHTTPMQPYTKAIVEDMLAYVVRANDGNDYYPIDLKREPATSDWHLWMCEYVRRCAAFYLDYDVQNAMLWDKSQVVDIDPDVLEELDDEAAMIRLTAKTIAPETAALSTMIARLWDKVDRGSSMDLRYEPSSYHLPTGPSLDSLVMVIDGRDTYRVSIEQYPAWILIGEQF